MGATTSARSQSNSQLSTLNASLALPALDDGECLMVVDAFEILGFDAVPGDVVDGSDAIGNITNDVFDKNRIVVCAFGDRLFVRSFEDAEEFATGTFLDEGHEFFDPNRAVKADREGGRVRVDCARRAR